LNKEEMIHDVNMSIHSVFNDVNMGIPPIMDENTQRETLKKTIDTCLSKDFITYYFPTLTINNINEQEKEVNLRELLFIEQISSLTMDVDLIKNVIRENKRFTLNEDTLNIKVKLNERTIIMLRDIPSDTNPEDIKSLFGKYANNIQYMVPEIEDNYYVVFDSSENTLEGFNFVRTQIFNGNQVQCCIKANHSFMNIYSQPPNQQNPYVTDNTHTYLQNTRGSSNNRGRYGGRKYRNGKRGGRPKNYRNDSNSNTKTEEDLGTYWPPLTGVTKVGGYQKEFRKYSQEQIADIISSISGEKMVPKFENQCTATTDEYIPHLELQKPIPSTINISNFWIGKSRSKKENRSQQNSNENKKRSAK
jgi:hypothetical protein